MLQQQGAIIIETYAFDFILTCIFCNVQDK